MNDLRSIEPAAFVHGIEADMYSAGTRFSSYIEQRSGVVPPELGATPDVIVASDWEVQDPINVIQANRITMEVTFVESDTNPEDSISYGLDLLWNDEPVYSYLFEKGIFYVTDENTWSRVSDQTMDKLLQHLERLEAEGYLTRRS